MAHVVLHRHHFPWLVLSRELDLGYCRHVVRRVAEESRGGGSRRRGGHKGEKFDLELKFFILRFLYVAFSTGGLPS